MSEITFTKEISEVFRCHCNNKWYDSHNKLVQHQKTKNHKAWEQMNELRELKIILNRSQNTEMCLKNKAILFEKKYQDLEKKYQNLEKKYQNLVKKTN